MPKNGFELDLQAPRHGADAAVGIDRDVGQAIERKIFGQRAGQWTLHVPAPIGAELDVEHLDRQRIAALGTFDVDRAGQDVAAEVRLQLAQNIAMLGQHIERIARQDFGRTGDAMDGSDVARLDAQRRFQLAVEIAPVTGLGR